MYRTFVNSVTVKDKKLITNNQILSTDAIMAEVTEGYVKIKCEIPSCRPSRAWVQLWLERAFNHFEIVFHLNVTMDGLCGRRSI